MEWPPAVGVNVWTSPPTPKAGNITVALATVTSGKGVVAPND